MVDQPLHVERQFVEAAPGRGGPGAEQEPAGRERGASEQRTKAAAKSVARHGRAVGAADGKGHARRCRLLIEKKGAPQHSRADTPPLRRQAGERVAIANSPDQADSR